MAQLAAEVIAYALTADVSGLINPVKKATESLQGISGAGSAAAKDVEKHTATMSESFNRLGNRMLAIGGLMTAGVSVPIVSFLKSGIDGMLNAEKRAAQTEQAIRSTGGAANVSADQVKGLVGGLRDMSGVSGGVIRDGANMLLTFTQIRNRVGDGNDIFNQATKSALNMSVAMGEDMQTASIRLGKALQDPIAGVTALRRVGVQLSDSQKEQIKNFVEMGDVASAQKVILKELETEFGGQAEAFGNTTAGQMAKAKNSLEQVKMEIAAGLAPAMSAVAGVIGGVSQAFTHLDSTTKAFLGSALIAFAAAGPLVAGVGATIKAVQGISTAVSFLKDKMASLRESGGVLNAIKSNWQGLATAFGGAAVAVGIDLIISRLHQQEQATRDAEKTTLQGIAGQVSGMGDLQGAIDRTRVHLEELKAQQDAAFDQDIDQSKFHPIWETTKTDELKQQINEAQKALDGLSDRAEHANGVLGTLQQQTGLSREQLMGMAHTLNVDLTQQDAATHFQTIATAIEGVSQKTGIAVPELVGLAKTFGIDLSGDVATGTEALLRAAQGIGSLTSQTGYTAGELDALAKKLGIDLKDGGDQAAQTLQKYAQWAHQAGYDSQVATGQINLLRGAVQATIMPWLDGQQAVTSFQQSLDQLPGQIKQIAEANRDGLSAEEAANARRHDAQALMGQMSQNTINAYLAQRQLLGANADTAEGQAVLNGILSQGAVSVDEIAKRFGVSKEVAAQYVQQLANLKTAAEQLPKNVPMTITVNTAEAKAKLDALKGQINSFYGTFHIPTPQLPNVVGPGGYRGGVLSGDTAYFAKGGVANTPTVVYGERNRAYPEYFISTIPAYRDRNRKLWQQAGAHLMAEGGVVGSASGGAVGGDGAAAGGDAVPVLVQIRDLLAQALAAGQAFGGAAPIAPEAAPTSAGGPAPAASPVAAAPSGGGDAAAGAAATTQLAAATTAYGVAAQTTAAQAQAFDAQMAQAAQATLPTTTAAVQQSDLSVQALTTTVAADLPLQGSWQGALAGSQVQLALTTAAVQALIAQMQILNSTQVQLHIEHAQVEEAAASIAGLASAVVSALGRLGLDNNALGQWLGVVLALPSGTLAGAMESGGVVGTAGAGMKGHTPTLVMEGSRSFDEYVIPTQPRHRDRAMKLLGGLHQDLGIPQMAAGGVLGKTPWGGTAATAPGTMGSATSGSMIAAAAFNVGGGGSQKFVDFAMAQTGDAYVWGNEGPDSWDCSGLVLGAAAAAGLPGLPHYSGSQYDMSTHIPVGQAISTPGAILWHPGHIAISRGNGMTIEARGINYGVGSWPAEGRFTGGGLLPFPGASGSVSDALPGKWTEVGKYISDRFREAGIGVGPSVGGESGEAGGGGPWTGRISNFGGPGDYQPTAYGPDTQYMYERGFPYAAMRLTAGSYNGVQGEIPLPPGAWVSVAKGGNAARVQILDWGPRGDLNRIIDVAPYIETGIGATTNDTVTVAALAAGGKIGVYDQGGMLPEGWSIAGNFTGSPEPVIPASNLRGGGATQLVVNVTVHGSVSTEDDLVDAIARGLQRRARRGFIEVDMASTA